MLRQQPNSTILHSSAVWRLSIAAVLLLVGCPFSALADNNGCGGAFPLAACGCYLQGLGCALSGRDGCFALYQGCMKNLPPDPPPAPPSAQPPSDDDACYGGEAVRGPAQARVAGSGAQPRDGSSGSGGITFLDPVPDPEDPDGASLQNAAGTDVIADNVILGTQGRSVMAVAADSAGRVVLRIPWCKADRTINVTLLDENQAEVAAASVGTLSTPGGSEKKAMLPLVTHDVNGNAMAFAVYQPPPDFARASWTADNNQPSRTVNFKVESTTGKYTTFTSSLTLLRPPVVLVHGIWDSYRGWGSFPLNKATFSVFVANYDIPLLVLAASPNANPNDRTTSWMGWALMNASANQLSFTYNAPGVHDQIAKGIVAFRRGNNVVCGKAAAAQADVVGHSLGGLVTRQISLLPEYLDKPSFTFGDVHKLITIGTPHYGTPLATLLLQDPNAELLLAYQGSLVFGSWVGKPSIGAGAVYDMQGEASISRQLATLNGSNPHALPVAAIAGKISDINDLQLRLKWDSLWTNFINALPQLGAALNVVGLGCGPCQIEMALNNNHWEWLFNGKDNDGMVSVTSQLHGTGDGWPGLIHSPRLWNLGFSGPGELQDPVNIPQNVVYLLNRPVDGDAFTKF